MASDESTAMLIEVAAFLASTLSLSALQAFMDELRERGLPS
jgi:hypothetical protein